jgi:hypothetical protein
MQLSTAVGTFVVDVGNFITVVVVGKFASAVKTSL